MHDAEMSPSTKLILLILQPNKQLEACIQTSVCNPIQCIDGVLPGHAVHIPPVGCHTPVLATNDKHQNVPSPSVLCLY